MKKLLLLLIVALPFVSCGDRTGSKRLSEKDSLQMELYAKDSLLNEVFASLDEITASLSLIKEREQIMTSVISSGEIKKEPVAQITEDIQAIDKLLQNNRETLARLEKSAAQLKRANVKISSLENLIVRMTTQIETKDTEIARMKNNLRKMDIEVTALSMTVDDLNVQVEDLAGNKQRLEGEVKSHEDKLNTAYYIVGARKELLAKEILFKSGIIGRTLKLNENRSLDTFTQVDARTFDEVIIGHKNVELVTTHPTESYEFVMNDNGVFMSLVITDRAKFWEYSKVLVVCHK